MRKKFEYEVWRVNFHRVTFVGDKWQGKDTPESKRETSDVESCPTVWDCLQRAGLDGWELVGAVNASFASPETRSTTFRNADQISYQFLFLKRELGV